MASNEAERRFIWAEANAKMAAARTPQEFAAAADTYRRLESLGVRNGPLFYNLGTALLKAGKYEEAEAALLRAERYLGTTEDIERNLLLALQKGQAGVTARLPWYRPLLFWHYGLGMTVRVRIAAGAFSVFWFALLLRRMNLGERALVNTLSALAVLVVILFSSSVASSVYQEHREMIRHRWVPPSSGNPGESASSGSQRSLGNNINQAFPTNAL